MRSPTSQDAAFRRDALPPAPDGPTLREMLRTTGALSETRAVELVLQMASALERTHALGISHRELTPDRVVVDQRDRVFLTGFSSRPEGTRGAMDHVGVSYAPPEWVDPDTVNGQSWDVYALGMIFYELLTGDLPFRMKQPAKNDQQLFFFTLRHLAHPPLDPGRSVAPELRQLIKSMTHSSQAGRLAEMESVRAELERYLEGGNGLTPLGANLFSPRPARIQIRAPGADAPPTEEEDVRDDPTEDEIEPAVRSAPTVAPTLPQTPTVAPSLPQTPTIGPTASVSLAPPSPPPREPEGPTFSLNLGETARIDLRARTRVAKRNVLIMPDIAIERDDEPVLAMGAEEDEVLWGEPDDDAAAIVETPVPAPPLRSLPSPSIAIAAAPIPEEEAPAPIAEPAEPPPAEPRRRARPVWRDEQRAPEAPEQAARGPAPEPPSKPALSPRERIRQEAREEAEGKDTRARVIMAGVLVALVLFGVGLGWQQGWFERAPAVADGPPADPVGPSDPIAAADLQLPTVAATDPSADPATDPAADVTPPERIEGAPSIADLAEVPAAADLTDAAPDAEPPPPPTVNPDMRLPVLSPPDPPPAADAAPPRETPREVRTPRETPREAPIADATPRETPHEAPADPPATTDAGDPDDAIADAVADAAEPPARFSFGADVSEFLLRAEDGQLFATASVPAGGYTLDKVTFANGTTITPRLFVTVEPGASVSVVCNQQFELCRLP